jgi:hypothetical protein
MYYYRKEICGFITPITSAQCSGGNRRIAHIVGARILLTVVVYVTVVSTLSSSETIRIFCL